MTIIAMEPTIVSTAMPQVVALTIVGDLYPAQERGKVQGYIASVWAIAAILGPVTCGLIVAHLTWPWIFWIDVPIGVAAMFGFAAFLHEERRVGQSRSPSS